MSQHYTLPLSSIESRRVRRHFWDSRSGTGILLASGAMIIIFSLLAILGGLVAALSILQVLFLFGFSVLFSLAIEVPKNTDLQEVRALARMTPDGALPCALSLPIPLTKER